MNEDKAKSTPPNDGPPVDGTEQIGRDEAASDAGAVKEQPAGESGNGREESAEEVEAHQEIAEPEPEEPIETESDRFLRLAADFDNHKKRTAREFDEVVRSANARLLKELVGIVDNFERALEDKAAVGDADAYRRGVELIHNQLCELLARERVTLIETVGKRFDPHCHEAMLQIESEQYDEGIICGELQKGYKIDDRVIRHARVIVSGGAKKKENDKNES